MEKNFNLRSKQTNLRENIMRPGLMPRLCRIIFVMALPLTAFMSAANAAGDLSRQDPITITVDLGSPGKHEFIPNKLRFETGKLYKLVLRNASDAPHYFTSHAFSQLIFTRKVQVTQERDGKMVTLAYNAARTHRDLREIKHCGRRNVPGTPHKPCLPQHRMLKFQRDALRLDRRCRL